MKPTPHSPVCHLIAGPNGAGKSTFALEHLPALAKCTEFVNADLIAAGLSPLDPTRSALRAGRLVLERIKEFGLAKKTFGFESTLSGRGYLSTLAKLKKGGFRVALYYLWLPSPKVAIARVKGRVKLGGHHVPSIDIRRRFKRSLENLPAYFAITDELFLFDASTCPPTPVFLKTTVGVQIENPGTFRTISPHLNLP
jgi:predicted ABC-type ATPase